MKNRIEPPVLMSRITTLVLAMSLVVLAVLGITLYKMFPLNKPQIFFLETTIRDQDEVKLTEMDPSPINLEEYKKAFVREYIRHRNEIFSNTNAMHQKWNNVDGAVKMMSSPDVYAAFTETALFKELMSNTAGFAFKCPVHFDGAPMPLGQNQDKVYQVKITYFCEDNARRTTPKKYTIRVKISPDEGRHIKWADRIENPLGIRVIEYNVTEGGGDPLNTVFTIEEELNETEGLI